MSDIEADFFNDGKTHKLSLGASFRKHPNTAFHTVRYDFKPASIDQTQEGELEVQDGHEVSITLPNVVDCKTACTVYKGSKKPALKECVLIYNHATGEFSLERISSQIQVKKTRLAGNANFSSRPTLPAPPVPKMPKASLPKKQRKNPSVNNNSAPRKQETPSPQSQKKNEQSTTGVATNSKPNSEMAAASDAKSSTEPSKVNRSAFSPSESPSSSSNSSNSSSSDDSSSSSDEETNNSAPPPKPLLHFESQLHEDLELSESGSESD